MTLRKSLFTFALCSVFIFGACGSSHKDRDDDDEDVSTSKLDDDDDYGVTSGNPSQQPTAAYNTSKPDEMKMTSDLTGRTISEGVAEGYHPQDWTYTIEYGQVSGLYVENVVTDEPDLYVVEVNMHITPSGTNYYYDTNLKLTYVNTPSDGWQLDRVTSLGMNVVSNGVYDDSISARIGEGLFLRIQNNSDAPLWVGGRYYDMNFGGSWEKYLTFVPAYSEVLVGEGIGLSSVGDYKVDFVVKER